MENREIYKSFSFVAFDIKTTGIKPAENNIIEIGASLYENGEEIKRFHSYIQPTFDISAVSLASLDVSLNTLNHYGQPLKVVLNELDEFASGKTALFLNNFNQSEFLTYHIFNQNLVPFINYHYDLLEIIKIYLPFLEQFDLEDIAAHFSLPLKDLMTSEDKATLYGKLFYIMLDFITDKVPFSKNRLLYSLASNSDLDTALPSMLQKITEYQQKTALLKTDVTLPKFPRVNFIDAPRTSSVSPDVKDVLATNGLFGKKFEGYEEREGQIMMAEAVDNAIKNDKLLLVEAGTGVGKSFAYLIPAISYASKKKEKIVVSTNTKNLQEQLFYKDLPTLAEILPQDFKAIIIKGRENYFCQKRWQEAMLNINSVTSYEAHGLLYLIIWQAMTQTGDISENSVFEKSKFPGSWRKIMSERYFCSGKKCQFFKECHVMNVKKKLEDSNILIVNHSLLLSDLMNEHQSLGEYNKVIIDEAHNLPSVAGKHLGISLTYSEINQVLNHIIFIKNKKKIGILQSFLSVVENTMPDSAKQKTIFISQVNRIIDFIADNKREFLDFFNKLTDTADQKGSYGKYRLKTSQAIPSFESDLAKLGSIWMQLKNHIFTLTETLRDTSDKIVHEHEKHLTSLEGVLGQVNEISETFEELATPKWSEYAVWLEMMHQRSGDFPTAIINYAPIEVNDKLNEYLYNAIDTLIMTSATLAIRGVFKFFLNQSGLALLEDRPIEQLSVPSPFNYQTQSQLLLPSFLPLPKDQFFVDQAIKVINELVCQNPQGCMVLFTSYKDLNYAYNSLQESFFEHGIKLLAQGISGNRTAILNEFKNNKRSVLLGTSSFWEGVDVQGESLSLLIVFKLPFQVPSEPLVEAYIEKLEADKKNSFMHFMLPNALLKVRQGFGRLIRSKKDRGIVIILDKRVTTTRYGVYFRQVLPTPVTIVPTDIELVNRTNKFFNSFNGE